MLLWQHTEAHFSNTKKSPWSCFKNFRQTVKDFPLSFPNYLSNHSKKRQNCPLWIEGYQQPRPRMHCQETYTPHQSHRIQMGVQAAEEFLVTVTQQILVTGLLVRFAPLQKLCLVAMKFYVDENIHHEQHNFKDKKVEVAFNMHRSID